MRRSVRSFALAVVVAVGFLSLPACSGNSDPVTEPRSQTSPDTLSAVVDDTLRLALGAEDSAAQGRVSVRFLERVSDSRCPANAVCVWAGDATVRLRVHAGAEAQEAAIGITQAPTAIVVGGFRVTVLELSPYPGLHGEGDPQPAPAVVVRVVRG